jgi:hypothetical protein
MKTDPQIEIPVDHLTRLASGVDGDWIITLQPEQFAVRRKQNLFNSRAFRRDLRGKIQFVGEKAIVTMRFHFRPFDAFFLIFVGTFFAAGIFGWIGIILIGISF